MKTFNLPDLGEGLADAEIIRWHVKPGERINVDEPMLAVETAKAVVEVPSPWSGVVKATHGQPGDVIATGALLVEFEVDASQPVQQSPASANRHTTDAGTVVGSMPTSDEDFVEAQSYGSSTSTGVNGAEARGERIQAVPAARAIATRLGVELTRVRGSGRSGLITVDDVLSASASATRPTPSGGGTTATSASGPARASARPTAAHDIGDPTAAAAHPRPLDLPPSNAAAGEIEQLRGPRRAMAQSMALARDTVMGCTLFDDADLHNWDADQDVTTRLLRAIAEGCAAEPALNAWFDGEAQTRRKLSRIDVAIAVDTPEGLIVPVVRNIAGRPVADLRRDVDRLKRSTRDRTVAPEDLRDFTFMLSNFGMIAGRYATPVVVPPAVAILGSGRLGHDVVAVRGGGIESHLRMPLSLTFDHRCVTGGEAARFMAALIRDLQKGN